MKTKTLLMLALFIVLGLLVTPDGFAAIYKYIDKDGMVCFADDLQSIPEQYRPSVKIVSGEATEGVEQQPPSQDPQPVQMEPKAEEAAPTVTQVLKSATEAGKKGSFGKRALISGLVLVSAVFAFIILGIVDSDHMKIIKITRVVIVWGVSVYLIFNHARDVVHVFSMMGSKVEEVQNESAEKGKKTVKALKKLNDFLEQKEDTVSTDSGEAGQEKRE